MYLSTKPVNQYSALQPYPLFVLHNSIPSYSTLEELSIYLFADKSCWPKLWSINPHITNPWNVSEMTYIKLHKPTKITNIKLNNFCSSDSESWKKLKDIVYLTTKNTNMKTISKQTKQSVYYYFVDLKTTKF